MSADHALPIGQRHEPVEARRVEAGRDPLALVEVSATERRNHVVEQRFFLLGTFPYILLPLAKPLRGWLKRIV